MPRFEHISSVVKSLCLRSGDILQRNKGLYLDCANDTWNDMNLTTVKQSKREIFKINKRTNTIDLPCNYLDIASVSIIDHHGVIWPLYLNDRLHKDLVVVDAMKDCACEKKCGYALCNIVKGYEAIVSTKSDFLPNGSPVSFSCVDRKAVDKNGFFYSECQYPQRIYTNGVWTNTILFTETKTLCKVELDENGCICDSEENEKNIFHCCGIVTNDGIPFGGDANSFCGDQSVDTWKYFASSQIQWFGVQCGSFNHCRDGFRNIYNIEEGEKRLIFPHDFVFKEVLVRWYYDVDLKDMYIPIVAKQTFMTGLQYFSVENNDKKQGLANIYGAKYSRQKWGLFLELNKNTIDNMRMTLNPPIYVPSYHIRNRRRDWFIE
jgi:hypothetical protein